MFVFFFQNVYAPDPDPEMTEEFYERTKEQNDELGITDMKTENYTWHMSLHRHKRLSIRVKGKGDAQLVIHEKEL